MAFHATDHLQRAGIVGVPVEAVNDTGSIGRVSRVADGVIAHFATLGEELAAAGDRPTRGDVPSTEDRPEHDLPADDQPADDLPADPGMRE